MKKLLVVLLAATFLLGGCFPKEPPKVEDASIAAVINWQSISAPPGYTGQCWAYFAYQYIYQNSHSYSGVFCWKD